MKGHILMWLADEVMEIASELVREGDILIT